MIAAARRAIKRLRIHMLNSAIRASLHNQQRARWMTLDGIKLSMIEHEHQVALMKRRKELLGG